MKDTPSLHLPTWANAPGRTHFDLSQPAQAAEFRRWLHESADAFIEEFTRISADNAPSEGSGHDVSQDMAERAPQLFNFDKEAAALVSDTDAAWRIAEAVCNAASKEFLELRLAEVPQYEEE